MNAVPFNGESYWKQKGPRTSHQSSSSYETSSQKFLYYIYISSEQVWWCNINGFWIIPKVKLANLCKPIKDIIHYSLFNFHFEFGKYGKEIEKLQKFEYLGNKKSFLDKIKNIFYRFWRNIIWWKNKNLIKIVDRILNIPQLILVSIFPFLYTCSVHILC